MVTTNKMEPRKVYRTITTTPNYTLYRSWASKNICGCDSCHHCTFSLFLKNWTKKKYPATINHRTVVVCKHTLRCLGDTVSGSFRADKCTINPLRVGVLWWWCRRTNLIHCCQRGRFKRWHTRWCMWSSSSPTSCILALSPFTQLPFPLFCSPDNHQHRHPSIVVARKIAEFFENPNKDHNTIKQCAESLQLSS